MFRYSCIVNNILIPLITFAVLCDNLITFVQTEGRLFCLVCQSIFSSAHILLIKAPPIGLEENKANYMSAKLKSFPTQEVWNDRPRFGSRPLRRLNLNMRSRNGRPTISTEQRICFPRLIDGVGCNSEAGREAEQKMSRVKGKIKCSSAWVQTRRPLLISMRSTRQLG